MSKLLMRLFPVSCSSKNFKGLLSALAVYILFYAAVWVISLLVGGVPLVGAIMNFLLWFLGIYNTLGIIVALLIFFKIVK